MLGSSLQPLLVCIESAGRNQFKRLNYFGISLDFLNKSQILIWLSAELGCCLQLLLICTRGAGRNQYKRLNFVRIILDFSRKSRILNWPPTEIGCHLQLLQVFIGGAGRNHFKRQSDYISSKLYYLFPKFEAFPQVKDSKEQCSQPMIEWLCKVSFYACFTIQVLMLELYRINGMRYSENEPWGSPMTQGFEILANSIKSNFKSNQFCLNFPITTEKRKNENPTKWALHL